MKKNKLFVSLLAAGMLAISPVMADDVVTLTTSKSVGQAITLKINQPEEAITVDWGNGTAVTVDPTDEDYLTLAGTVGGANIKITSASALETLICDNSGLTAIDLSQATNLRSLFCQNNELTALDVTKCKNLTDLNCANNKIKSFVLTESTNPNVEVLNISGNEIAGNRGTSSGTTFSYNGSSLSYLDISHNAFTGSLSTSGNTKLDVLKCAGNSLVSVSAPASTLSSVMCADNNINTISVGSNTVNLRHVFAENNKLGKIDVSASEKLEYLSVSNNNLTNVALPNYKLYAYVCDHNSLSFNSLPETDNVEYYVYAPQSDELKINKLLTAKYIASAQKTIYYMLVSSTSSVFDTGKKPYVIDLSSYLTDASGAYGNIEVTFKSIAADGTESVIPSSDIRTSRAASRRGWYGFKKAYGKVFAEFTCSHFPDLVQKTLQFVVANSIEDINESTSVGSVVANADNALTVHVENGAIVLTSGAPTAVRIYGTDGKQVWQGTVNGTEEVNLSTGIYFVNGKKVVL